MHSCKGVLSGCLGVAREFSVVAMMLLRGCLLVSRSSGWLLRCCYAVTSVLDGC